MFIKYIYIFVLVFYLLNNSYGSWHKNVTEKHKRALQADHEKPLAIKWRETFIDKRIPINYQMHSLVKLLNFIAKRYLDKCTVMILYDSSVMEEDRTFLQQLFSGFPLPYVQGTIDKDRLAKARSLLKASKDHCVSYVMFLSDVMKCKEVVGDQNESKMVIIARSTQWRVHEFLSSEVAQNYVNLLVIAKSEKTSEKDNVVPYILYTHEMYIDGLGSSRPHILTSWYKTKLSRPFVKLFPKKMTNGFAGHRFIIAIADQPPFTINRGKDTNDDIKWEGVEVRLIKLLSEKLNFTRDYHEAKDAATLGSGDAVIKMMQDGKANLGLSGLYVTQERMVGLEMSHMHSQDCAVFISITSTALPRYRAILGPFQWTVWLAITLIYLFAIFPISFSDRLTLKHLIKKPEEMENMFWYVFGTFTNAFSFSSKDAWNKSTKMSTRLFVGWYWIFTIIITACYTGSVIAFVTLPVYPTTVDTVQQLLNGRFKVGTLDRGGWQYWFENSTDKASEKLLKNIEYLPDVQSGLKNITTAFFWSYAFLGSRAQLDYIVRTNFTTSNKRSLLHISSECFAPYAVGVAFPKSAVYKSVLNSALLRAFQSGLVTKLKNDVEWDIMRSSTGKLLQANSVGSTRILAPEDRSLTLQDTQGMFLLLGAGFIIGGASLLSEWLGGCLNFCKGKVRSRVGSIATENKPIIYPTPLQDDEGKDCNNTILGCQEMNGSLATIRKNERCEVLIHSEDKDITDLHQRDLVDSYETSRKSESGSEPSSPMEDRISDIFNFDYLFGENSSVDTVQSSNDITVDD